MRSGTPHLMGIDLTLVVLCLVPAVMVLGNAALIPALPGMRATLGLAPAQIALLITVFSGAAGVALPLAGPLSDRWGRKPVIVSALIIYGIGSGIATLAALWPSLTWVLLLAGRTVQGIGAAGTQPIAWAMAGDLYSGAVREKTLGLMETSNGLSKVVSPILGAVVAAQSWVGPFILFTVVAWAGAVAAAAFLPRRTRAQRPRPDYRAILGPNVRRFAPAVIAAFPAFMALFGLLTYLSEVLETRHGLVGASKGLVLALPLLVSAVVSLIAGLSLAPLGHPLRAAAALGLAVEGGGFILLLVLVGSPWFFAALVAVGAGNGLLLPALNTMATSSASQNERGLVTALYGTVRFVGVALGPLLFGIVWPVSEPLALGGTAALLLVGAAAMWLTTPGQGAVSR